MRYPELSGHPTKGAIRHDWIPMNQYTTPIRDIPSYQNSAIIVNKGNQSQLPVACYLLTYQRFWNEEYQYIFEPFWDIIDGASVDLSLDSLASHLRLSEYYFVNCRCAWLDNHSIPPNREDVMMFMYKAGLSYYDRFEWLKRTSAIFSCDRTTLIPIEAPRRLRTSALHSISQVKFGDIVIMDSKPRISLQDLFLIGGKLQYHNKIYVGTPLLRLSARIQQYS